MTSTGSPRRPQVFEPVTTASTGPDGHGDQRHHKEEQPAGARPDGDQTGPVYRPTIAGMKRRFSWGALFISTVSGLIMLMAGIWLTRFVEDLLQQGGWLGRAAFALLCLAILALIVIIGRELLGLLRLKKLQKFREEVKIALDSGDIKGERACVKQLKSLYEGRPDMRWPLARFKEHEADIHDAGALMELAERDLIMMLDERARTAVTDTAKRVSVVTAISPIALFDMLFVLAQNLKLLRALATLYGARPGVLGSLKLAKLVLVHIIATGGLALGDEMFGQILGHDLMRRMSRRLGEGVFNGVMSARIGIAAITILRPLPHIASSPVRLRELVPHIFRKAPQQDPAK